MSVQREQLGQLQDKVIYRQYEKDEELVRFVESVTWGVGETQYEHYYALHRLEHLQDGIYFSARQAETDELMGVVIFGRRRILGVKAYYIRFFAVSPKIRGQKITTPLAVYFFDYLRATETEPCIFYASTDRTNPSINRMVGKLGFEEISFNRTMAFSRFSPKPSRAVSAMSEAEFAAFLPRLEAFYSGHGFWTADNVGKDDSYFVLRDDSGEIVAGLQAYKGFWRIEKMPGFMGKVVLPLVPYTPLRIIFNPKAFHFIAFEGIYFAPGQAHRLSELMEAVLHHFRMHSALFWLNIHDPMADKILKNNNLGLLNLFVKDTLARFLASFHHVDPAIEAELRKRPVYNSSLDYI
jgi:hypothetical protein